MEIFLENKTVKIVANKVDQVVEVGTKPSVETTVLSHKNDLPSESCFGVQKRGGSGCRGVMVRWKLDDLSIR